MANTNSTEFTAPRRADARVRAGSPDPALLDPTPFNRERRERVQPANPESAQPLFNRERRERVPSPNPATGPKTQSGKSRSSKNAVTHGLRATKIDNAVAPELRAAYETLRKQYLDDYKPTGAIESTLLDMVIFAAWQLYKVREMELFTDIDLGMPGSFGRSEKLSRYRGSHERLFFRSLNQLKQIQQERALRETDQKAALPAHLAPGVRLKTLQDHLRRLQRHPKTKTARANRIPIAANAKSRSPKAPPESPKLA